MDKSINAFVSGIYNLIDPENTPKDSSQDSKNWITQDGKIILAGGRKALGDEGLIGRTNMLWYGYKAKGGKVLYRKINDKIQYLLVDTWTDVITGLTDIDMSVANYSSLAGAFTLFCNADGFWMVNNAHPASAIDLYDSTKNYKGYILIDKGRALLWNRPGDKTGLYGSWIDKQNSTSYTNVASEAIGALGSITYTGTLAFKAGGARRNCFGGSSSGAFFTGTVAAGTETFVDNYDGTITGSRGGTGTINYNTGAYSVTFSAITTGAVTSNYQWQDFAIKGIADFSKSSPRQEGEGFQFPQDEGGDPILNVLVGQDGAYYSMKEQSTYRLSIDADDKNATNEVFRKDIGLPYWKASISTGNGIVFMNTANPTKPEMTVLRQNPLGDNLEPIVLFPQFKFSNYNYDSAVFDTYDRYIVVSCKLQNSVNNDIILLCNINSNTVDVVNYNATWFAKDEGNLYVGYPLTKSVYQIFSGFDDDGLPVDNYWIGKDDLLDTDNLKKVRRLRFKGLIDPDQSLAVYLDLDNSGFSLVGTIYGRGSYVDYSSPQTIGSNFIGSEQIGGGDTSIAYSYFCEIKVKTSKFRARTIKLVATGIGYVDVDSETDFNILQFENRIPSKYRNKQNVSLNGVQNDLNNPIF